MTMTQTELTGNCILPTHHCFDDALDAIQEMVRADPSIADTADVLLVHGVCLAPPDGRRVAHAWVEVSPGPGAGCGDHVAGVAVVFAGILRGEQRYFAAAREEYYVDQRVVEATKYTIRQAWDENRRSGHYGPWLQRYRELTRRRSDET